MARDVRRSDRERFKYGICLNDECECCKDKTVQQIPMRKDFVCEKCGKELRECPPLKKKSNLPIIIGAAVLAAIIIGGICFLTLGKDETPVMPDTEIETPVDSTSVDSMAVDTNTIDTTDVDNKSAVNDSSKAIKDVNAEITEKPTEKTVIKVVERVVEKEKSSSSSSSSGSVNLGYAKFTGSVKNGKPDGMGRMTFSSSHVIDSRDPKGRTAEPGDYVVGEWKDGKLVQGRWFGSDNNSKGGIIIGM